MIRWDRENLPPDDHRIKPAVDLYGGVGEFDASSPLDVGALSPGR